MSSKQGGSNSSSSMYGSSNGKSSSSSMSSSGSSWNKSGNNSNNGNSNGKVSEKMWKDLTEDERTEFAEEYEMEKAEYDRAMMQYKNSPAYQVRIVLDRTHDSNSQLLVLISIRLLT